MKRSQQIMHKNSYVAYAKMGGVALLSNKLIAFSTTINIKTFAQNKARPPCPDPKEGIKPKIPTNKKKRFCMANFLKQSFPILFLIR